MVSILSIEQEVNKNTMKVGDLPTKTGPQALQPDEVSDIDTTSKIKISGHLTCFLIPKIRHLF